jgi:hypothetical protein
MVDFMTTFAPGGQVLKTLRDLASINKAIDAAEFKLRSPSLARRCQTSSWRTLKLRMISTIQEFEELEDGETARKLLKRAFGEPGTGASFPRMTLFSQVTTY